MSGRNGSRFPGMFPGGMPPMGGADQPVGLQVAAPLNHFQLTALMASILMAREPTPGLDEGKARDAQARQAVVRALDILGHAAYYTGRGVLDGTIASAERSGQTDRKAALEAEEAAARAQGQPEKKIITDLEG